MRCGFDAGALRRSVGRCTKMSDDYLDRFGGVGRLFGREGLARLRGAHVCVVGVGGVGSWTVEGLARSGVGALTLVDLDDVCVTNVNRQLPALDGTVGRTKVSVLAERIRLINPACRVTEAAEFFTASSAERLLAEKFSYVVDAIDRMSNKALVIGACAWVAGGHGGGGRGEAGCHAGVCGGFGRRVCGRAAAAGEEKTAARPWVSSRCAKRENALGCALRVVERSPGFSVGGRDVRGETGAGLKFGDGLRERVWRGGVCDRDVWARGSAGSGSRDCGGSGVAVELRQSLKETGARKKWFRAVFKGQRPWRATQWLESRRSAGHVAVKRPVVTDPALARADAEWFTAGRTPAASPAGKSKARRCARLSSLSKARCVFGTAGEDGVATQGGEGRPSPG